MIIETQVPLQAHNTFGIAAKAERMLRLRSMEDVAALLTDPIRLEPHFVLGGGSNIVITGAKRDDLQAAMALIRKDMPDLPLSFDNFRD